MVRKTTRVAALKASEKTKPTRRSSRRHKSTSESDSSGNESLSSVAQKQKKPIEKDSSGESDTDSKKPLKKRTRSKAQKQTDVEPTPKKTRESRRAKNKQQPEVEEVNQDVDSKGKSVSIDRCNSDSVDSETANQNVQVTDESPVDTKDDDNPPDVEVSKNGKEIPTEISVNVSESIVAEMSCDQSSEIVSEETSKVEVTEQSVSDLPPVENTPDLTQSNVEEPADEATAQSVDNDSKQAERVQESESVETRPEPEEQKVAEEPQEEKTRTRKLRLNRKPVEPLPTPTEEKKEEVTEPKKKITLKRPEISKPEEKPEGSDSKLPQTQEQPESQWGSVYESKSKDSAQCDKPTDTAEPKSPKKIVLKRPVSEDHQSESDKEKNEKVSLERSSSNEESRKRRLSTTDNIVINQRRRRSSVVEKSASESEGECLQLNCECHILFLFI